MKERQRQSIVNAISYKNQIQDEKFHMFVHLIHHFAKFPLHIYPGKHLILWLK
jgi:hypothetical protein